MAEIHARRRLRLRQLLEERFEGNQSAMGRAVNYSRVQFFIGRRGNRIDSPGKQSQERK